MIQDKIFFDEKDPTGLSYNTPFTFYGSYEGRLWSKSPSGSIQYYTQNSDLSAYATTGSNQFSGSQTITGSLTVTGTITGTVAGTTSTASYVEYTNVANKPALISGSAQISDFGIFATTGSNGFNGSQSITGSLTVTGQVVAQTLNVQQVTSSVVYSSGSNVFGNSLANTQQFTGSVGVTGSLTVAGALNGTSASFTSSVTSGGLLLNTAGYLGSRSLRAASDLLILYGGTAGFNFTDHTNSNVLVSINNSGSATFSNIISVGYDSNNRSTIRLTSNAANRQAAIYFYGNNAESAVLGYEGGSEIVSGGQQGDFVIRNVLSGKDIILDTNGGNVGVGTNVPNAPLHVIKDLGTSVTAVTRLRGSNSTARTTRLQFEDYNGTISDGLIDFVIPTAGSATGARLDIGVNSANISFFNGGNISIGTQADQGVRLYINGNTGIVGTTYITQTTTSNIAFGIEGNNNAQGAIYNYKIARQYSVVSLGTKLIIPFYSQGNLNGSTLVKISGLSAVWNTRTNKAFSAEFAVGHLTVLSDLNILSSTGNISSIEIAGMNIEINFTSNYTSATASGIYATIEYITHNPSHSIIINSVTMN